MRWTPLTLSAALLLGLGCRSANSGRELLEAELRTRTRQVDDLKSELHRLEALNCTLEESLKARDLGPQPGAAGLATSQVVVRGVAVGRGTGGLDDDRLPGDELLLAVVTPRDGDDQPIKVPGLIRVTALEVTPDGTKAPLGQWEAAPHQIGPLWRGGLFSTGYYLKLAWATPPRSEKVRVVAQFVLPDGRTFEGERDVTVRVVPRRERAAELGPALPAPSPEPEAGPEVLPPPAKVPPNPS